MTFIDRWHVPLKVALVLANVVIWSWIATLYFEK